MTAKLLDERIVIVQPSLVRALGLSPAVVLQQIHWHAQEGHGEMLSDGLAWVKMPYERISVETGLTEHQVRRAVGHLTGEGVLVAVQPEGYVRTKWYRIDHDHALFVSDCPSGKSADTKRHPRPFQARDLPPVPTTQNWKKEDGGDANLTAVAARQRAEEHMALTAELDAVEPSPATLDHIRAIRERRTLGADPQAAVDNSP